MSATPLMLCSLALCGASSNAPAKSIPEFLPPDPLGTMAEETVASEKSSLQSALAVSWKPSLAEDLSDGMAGPQWSKQRLYELANPIERGLTNDLPDAPQTIAPSPALAKSPSNRQKLRHPAHKLRPFPRFAAITPPETLMGSEQPDGQSPPILAASIELTQAVSDPNDDGFLDPDQADSPLNPEDVERELGEIRLIRPRLSQPRPRRQPSAQLLLRSSAFTSSNITGLEAIQESDIPLTNSATLLVTPKLGPETTLVAAAGYGLTRFPQEGDSNYDFLNLSVGVQQQLNRSTYAQLGWVQRQLYEEDSGSRLLLDNSLRFIVGRQDQLAEKLRLDSFYELRARFTDPNDRNRLANTLGARLRYAITPQLTSFLGYQLTLNDFTRVARFDTRHQIRAATTYSVSQTVFVGGSVSYLFGASSESAIELENFSAGLSLGVNIPFF